MSNYSVMNESSAAAVRARSAVGHAGCAICGVGTPTIAFKGRMICGDCLAYVKQCF